MIKTVIIELDFRYTPNEEDVYVCLKDEIKDRSLTWDLKKDDEIERLREEKSYAVDLLTHLNDISLDLSKRCDEKDAEIERLHRLLRQCQPFVDRFPPRPSRDLTVEIAEELKKPEVDDE